MAPAQLPLPFGLRTAFGTEDFLVADGNREAVAWIERWPDWPAPAVVLYGPAACGKSHLVRMFLARSGGGELTPADLAGAGFDLDRLLATIPAVAVDDADAAIGEGGAAVLLHLYNSARDHGRHLLLTGGAPPSQWRVALDDLRSRLNSCPAIGIAAPDDELMAAVLVKLLHDRQLVVGDGVVRFLLKRIERSFASARRVVESIDRASIEARRPITVPLVRAVLAASAEAGRRDDD